MNTESLQVATEQRREETPERANKTQGVLSRQRLRAENRTYAGTGGVSHENRCSGFTPAYLDTRTGIALPSRYADGVLAPVHILDGLPPHWIVERDACGRVLKTRAGIIAGFLRDGCFYTRDQAAALTIH